jgi:hypothetical protein
VLVHRGLGRAGAATIDGGHALIAVAGGAGIARDVQAAAESQRWAAADPSEDVSIAFDDPELAIRGGFPSSSRPSGTGRRLHWQSRPDCCGCRLGTGPGPLLALQIRMVAAEYGLRRDTCRAMTPTAVRRSAGLYPEDFSEACLLTRLHRCTSPSGPSCSP